MPSKKKFLEGIREWFIDIPARPIGMPGFRDCFRLLIEESFDASLRSFFKFFIIEFECAHLAVCRKLLV